MVEEKARNIETNKQESKEKRKKKRKIETEEINTTKQKDTPPKEQTTVYLPRTASAERQ